MRSWGGLRGWWGLGSLAGLRCLGVAGSGCRRRSLGGLNGPWSSRCARGRGRARGELEDRLGAGPVAQRRLIVGEEAPPGPVNGTGVSEVPLIEFFHEPFVSAEVRLVRAGVVSGSLA